MNKDNITYFKNVIKSEHFFVDLINMIIGIMIIVFSIIDLINAGNYKSFGNVFILGSLLSLLSIFKAVKQKSVFSIIIFTVMFFLTIIVITIIYRV